MTFVGDASLNIEMMAAQDHLDEAECRRNKERRAAERAARPHPVRELLGIFVPFKIKHLFHNHREYRRSH